MPVYGYRSPKLRSWALLTTAKDDFARIPKAELERFGTPMFVREIDPKRELPAGVRPKDLRDAEEHGYVFLEMAVIYEERPIPQQP
jgi:uncharacterized protein YcgL (UPF0745 family)